MRIDSTVVEAWVHAPTDPSLLFDGVRVLLRLLRRAEHLAGFMAYHPHLKRAKRRLMEIQHGRELTATSSHSLTRQPATPRARSKN